jgi:hypothetical protein
MEAMMATLIKPDGTQTEVTPKNGKTFDWKTELYPMLECDMLQPRVFSRKVVFIFDEDAYMKHERPAENPVATQRMAIYEPVYQPLLGPVLICTTQEAGY